MKFCICSTITVPNTKVCKHAENCDALGRIRNAVDKSQAGDMFRHNSSSMVSFHGVYSALAEDCNKFEPLEPVKPKRRQSGPRRKPRTKKVMEEQARLQSEAERAAKVRC